MGWPWPKHPCTDKYQGDDDRIQRAINSRFRFNFRTRDGKPLDVYRVEQLVESDEGVSIRLKNVERGPSIVILIRRAAMRDAGCRIEDINDAPTVVLSRHKGPSGDTEISLISARLQSVVVLPATVRPA